LLPKWVHANAETCATICVMKRVTVDDLYASMDSWDAFVDVTPGVDRWSTGSDWAFSAHRNWGTGPEVVLHDKQLGWALFGRVQVGGEDLADPGVEALIGPDSLWGFASPMVGPDPRALAIAVAASLEDEPAWDLVFLTGLIEGSPLDEACIDAFGARHQVFAGPVAPRLVGDLKAGFDHWWLRRSDKFRRNLRRAERAAIGAGLTIEIVDHLEPDVLLRRLLAIEATSWKGQEESGLLGGEMSSFYLHMTRSLCGTSRVRACVARLDGVDAGFILGAIRGDTYRGLQLSFTAGLEDLSVGHLLQLHEVRRLCLPGSPITRYDLGMDMPYKHSWADTTEETRALVIRR
jgi:hypothetical protein